MAPVRLERWTAGGRSLTRRSRCSGTTATRPPAEAGDGGLRGGPRQLLPPLPQQVGARPGSGRGERPRSARFGTNRYGGTADRAGAAGRLPGISRCCARRLPDRRVRLRRRRAVRAGPSRGTELRLREPGRAPGGRGAGRAERWFVATRSGPEANGRGADRCRGRRFRHRPRHGSQSSADDATTGVLALLSAE